MVRVVHTSDLHGEFYKLPEADIYVITGDMLPNYPLIKRVQYGYFGRGWTREIVPSVEERCQNAWFEKKFTKKKRTLRHFLGTPDAPVFVVRGNHDFVPLAPMFGGEVYEIGDPKFSHYACGLNVGGFRGINYIAGEWADEKDPTDFYGIMRKIPKNMDVILSHSPPYGILDGAFGEKYGVQAYASWILEKQYLEEKLPKLMAFGHVHNNFGTLEWDDGATVFSNAATTHMIIDIKED